MNLSTSTILIVDDSDDVRTIVRIFLERDAARAYLLLAWHTVLLGASGLTRR